MIAYRLQAVDTNTTKSFQSWQKRSGTSHVPDYSVEMSTYKLKSAYNSNFT